jgi:DNA-binding protein WhiA
MDKGSTMSFSAEVKLEMLHAATGQPVCCAEAQLYGTLLFGRDFSSREMGLRTERLELAEYVCAQLHDIELAAARLERAGKKWEIIVRAEDRLRVLARFGHDKNEVSLRIVKENFNCETCQLAFLRGVFLSCAAVSAPQRQYHLEFIAGYRRLAGDLRQILEESELPPPKLCQRNGVWLAYYKDSLQIEDVLAKLGAPLAMLDLVNVKIEKDMRNKVNRVVNFELANMGRSSSAAAAQLQAIARLREAPGLDCLPPPLREAALLRERAPEASLQELAALAAQPVTRSGMNHRLRRLVDWKPEPWPEGKFGPTK